MDTIDIINRALDLGVSPPVRTIHRTDGTCETVTIADRMAAFMAADYAN